MALYNIFRVVDLCRSKIDIDCDDSFIAYHVFKHIRNTNGIETLETVRDDSQIAIILENIKLDYEAFVNNIEQDIKELWNSGKYSRSDDKPLDPFELNKLLDTINRVHKQNNHIHVTNYKAFLDNHQIPDYY